MENALLYYFPKMYLFHIAVFNEVAVLFSTVVGSTLYTDTETALFFAIFAILFCKLLSEVKNLASELIPDNFSFWSLSGR